MAGPNTLATISMITRDAILVLANELDLVKRVNNSFSKEFGIKGAMIGPTLNIRRPIRPTVRTGNVAVVQPIVDTWSTLTFGDPIGTDYELTSQEMTFSVDDYFTKVVKPSVVVIAAEIERLGHQVTLGFPNLVGTPGVALTSATARTAITKALAVLNKNLAPREAGRKTVLMDPDFNGILVDSNASLFNPQPEISKIYTDGYQGRFSSFDFFMNQLTAVQSSVGTYGGTPLTNYATAFADNNTWSQTGTLVTDGWTATTTTLPVGTTFTIAGVYAVNPTTKVATANLQQFTVTAATTTDGSGNSTITHTPAIITSGGFQNVSNVPANNAAITVAGASGVATQYAMAFDRDAIAFASKTLVPFSTGLGKTATDPQTGVTIRVQQMTDPIRNCELMRFDAEVAWALLYGQLGTKIATT